MLIFLLSTEEQLNRKITFSCANKTLREVLGEIGQNENINFALIIDSEAVIPFINLNRRELRSFLREVCELFHLHMKLEGNSIKLEQCKERWKTYKVPFFFEDKKQKLESLEQEKKDETTSSTGKFWDELERVISTISNKKFVIDRYSGIVSVFGNCEVQKAIETYVDSLNSTIYKQVLVECKIVEIISEQKDNLNIYNVIEGLEVLKRSGAVAFFENIVRSVSQCCSAVVGSNTKIEVKIKNSARFLLMHQQTGIISVADRTTHETPDIVDQELRKSVISRVIKNKSPLKTDSLSVLFQSY